MVRRLRRRVNPQPLQRQAEAAEAVAGEFLVAHYCEGRDGRSVGVLPKPEAAPVELGCAVHDVRALDGEIRVEERGCTHGGAAGRREKAPSVDTHNRVRQEPQHSLLQSPLACDPWLKPQLFSHSRARLSPLRGRRCC